MSAYGSSLRCWRQTTCRTPPDPCHTPAPLRSSPPTGDRPAPTCGAAWSLPFCPAKTALAVFEQVGQYPIPVEIKSSPAPLHGPYDNHVDQLVGYCLLVEDSLPRPVAKSILKYRDREVRVLFTAEKRDWILGIVAAMREAQAGCPVGGSHEQVNKCRNCSVRSSCGESLGWKASSQSCLSP